jgi:hypothetical protein
MQLCVGLAGVVIAQRALQAIDFEHQRLLLSLRLRQH